MTPNPIDTLHRIQSVKALTGLSRTSIYRLAQEGKFPKPIKLGERASGWRQSEINAWMEERTTASRGGAK